MSGSLHDGKPWRDVVHIEDGAPGPRGGAAWHLTLSCGHLVFRAKPKLTPERAVTDMLPSFVSMAKRRRRIVWTAPKRVRCLWCLS